MAEEPEHRAYPYLLAKADISRPNQAWTADITYLPMARAFLYLVTIMDWHSRYGWLGDCPTFRRSASVSTPCRKRWVRADRRCSTSTRACLGRRLGAASSPAWSSPRSCRTMG